MGFFRSSSIQIKLTIAVLLTSVIGLSIAGVASELVERERFRGSLTNELTTHADTLALNSAASLVFNDRKAAQDLLRSLRVEHHIMAACLYDSQGRVFAKYSREDLGGKFAMPNWQGDAVQFGQDSLTVFRSFSLGSEKAGGIAIISDFSELNRQMKQFRQTSALILIVSILSIGLLSPRLVRLITEPILHLAQVARRVSREKDYSVKVIPYADDEVGELFDSFNQMLARIRERDIALETANVQLEQRVEERTRELQNEVSQRTWAEEALSVERGRLRALIDNVPDYMYVKDADCRFLVANLSVAKQMGAKTPEELLGKTDFDFYPREIAETFCNDERRVILSGQPEVNREEIGVDSQGKTSIVLTTQVPLRDKSGKVVGLAGVGRDITVLKQAQEEMRKAREAADTANRAKEEGNELVRLLLDSTAEAIYGIDLHGNCTFCNQACLRLLGYTETSDLLGRNMHTVLHHSRSDGTHYPVEECRIYIAFRRGEASHVDDEVLWRKDGSYFPAEYWSYPIRRGGQVIGAVVTFIDISERKETERKLLALKAAAENASRAKSEFLANMSHEIRTPLNGVIGMTDLALETDLTEDQREYLETVKMSADSLLTVINDILDFSKIEAGRMDLESIEFNLRDCLESTLKTMALRADEKGLELLGEIAPEVPEMLKGDPFRLRQILLNLLGNAIKFTSQGEVTLKACVDSRKGRDCMVKFTVADTGIGVPEGKLDSIFAPFTQADNSTTRKYGGTGLGLTISSRLVAMMGGAMWAESEVGKGSQFHFTAQFETADTAANKMSTPAQPEILRGVRVLVVDDNQTNRRILEGMLKHWEMVATSAGGGEEALAQMSSALASGEPFQLILTDSHMPAMDGFEFIEAIRHKAEFSAATIMMLTSAGHRGDALRCQRLGVAAYLLKPIRQADLREAMARVLRAPKQEGAIPLITRYSLQEAPERRKSLRILLAEDNLVNQRLATRLLEKRGHHVVVAANGHEALAALDTAIFDLVLMDMQMPEMDGFEATAVIRKREQGGGRHLPIVALTAHAMKGTREKCLAAGMDGYLPKPLRPQELDKVLELYVARLLEEMDSTERVLTTK